MPEADLRRRSQTSMDVGPPELIIVLVIVLVLFGGKKLPELARSLGQAKREFNESSRKGAQDDADSSPSNPSGGSTTT
jgi:sec-independent protein translocase protein TatA